MKNRIQFSPWKSISSLALTAVAVLVFAGCATFDNHSQRQASSLVKYLYPTHYNHTDKPGTPVLTLPLRVGVAFVPENTERSREYYEPVAPLAEQQKMQLLNDVSDQFRKYPFVKSIEVIPSAYLTPGGGFENVDQLRSMFNVDVIALVSYDQFQFSADSSWSFSYLTVVGAFVIPGQRNQTRTMVDAVVYDIPSRKLLFRAPGLSLVENHSAPINLSENLRESRTHGFQEASTNLVANLEVKLAEFREQIKSAPDEIKIVRSPGYVGGAGAVGIPEVVAAATLVLTALVARKKTA